MEVQGKIIAALPERSGVSARGEWKSQDFVIETPNGQYPRKMLFTVFGAERLQRFNIQAGQDVLVAFDIDAHEWNGRWFNDIRAYDVRPAVAGTDAVAFTQAAPAAQPAAQQTSSPVPDAPVPSADPFSADPAAGESVDDMPF